MTRAHKITFLAAAILGLGCGLYLGCRSAIETSDSLESSQYIAPTKVASDFARIQFLNADTDHARQAVMLQIHLLEQLELADKAFHQDGELWFAYVRLAMVEEVAGRTEDEQRALTRARTRYERRFPGGKQGSVDELKDIVRRLDQAADML